MSKNPFTTELGPVILAGVAQGNTDAIAEATRRIQAGSTSKWMRLCAEVMGTSVPAKVTVKDTITGLPVQVTTEPKERKSRKGTGVGGSEHTALRAEARTWRREQYHLGNKVTDRDACLHFGTLPAKELAKVGMSGLAKAIKEHKAKVFAEAKAA